MALARVGYSFFAGVLVYGVGFTRDRHPKAPAAAALAIIAVLAVVFVPPLSSAVVPLRDLTCVAFVFPALVYVAAAVTIPASWAGPVRVSADISYPLYVLHLPLYGVAIALLRHVLPRDSAQLNIAFLAVAPAAIICSAWCWSKVDERLRARLRRTFAKVSPIRTT